MKGFLYAILAIIILAVIIIVLLGRDGSTPTENNSPGADTDIIETETPNATSTDNTATSTSSGEVDEDTSTEVDVVVDLTGENFVYSQEEITVQKGDRVRINFTSTGGFHDWVVDAFNASTDRVQEGGSTSVEFVANEAGAFEYYCSVGNHRQLGMIGTLVVEE